MNSKLLSVIALALAAHAATAAPLVSADFESPTYSLGPIVGQNGWDTDTLDDQDAVVTNAKSFAGSNSLLLTAAASDYALAYQTFTYRGSTAAADSKVLITETNVWVGTSGTTGDDEGLAVLDLYAGSVHGAGLGIGTATGTVYFYGTAGGTNSYYSLNGGPTATLNAWNKLTIVLDFTATGAPVYYGGLNGSLTNLSAIGLNSRLTGTSTVTDVDPTVYGSLDESAFAYFDNVGVRSAQAVPEPASMAVLGLGAVAALRRRKK